MLSGFFRPLAGISAGKVEFINSLVGVLPLCLTFFGFGLPVFGLARLNVGLFFPFPGVKNNSQLEENLLTPEIYFLALTVQNMYQLNPLPDRFLGVSP